MLIGIAAPTGRMGFMALASLFSVAAVVECGKASATAVFVLASVIGFVILPDKSPLAFYTLFFGYYPIIKSIAENLKKPALQWSVKLAVFNCALTVIFVFMRELLMLRFFDKLPEAYLGVAIYIAFNIIFIIYDIGLSKLIGFYMYRIHNKIR